MSAPSSDGRPSVDSEPSATSSRTFLSRTSGTYVDHSESSSRPMTGAGSSESDSPLARDAIQEHDFARRKDRVRRSGGFLLDANFPSGPRQRHRRPQTPADAREGRPGARHGARRDREDARLSSNSSPLSREVQVDGQSAPNGDDGALVANAQHHASSQLRIAKTRRSVQTPADDRDASLHSTAPRQTIDPNQLVHMALNLSESRRRNASGGQLLAPQARAVSGAQREGSSSNHGPGSSLRQYLNEQRRASRNISPLGGKSSPSRHMSMSMQRSGSMAFPISQSSNPAAATLVRVEKARAYIELRIEYLRLLEYLPPLKPDTNAPGNFVISSNNMPGSPHAQLTRTPSHAGKQYELGRPYNPLQYIRNRRSRARERRTLDHASDEFADVDQVRDWVDRVEEHSSRSGYRGDNSVQLPKIHSDQAVNPEPVQPARPHKGWVFSPQELLADAHWLEQGDNKLLAENRHGRRIFPPREAKQQDFLQPRASKEFIDKRRRSWVDGLPGVSADPGTGDESDRGSERGRKRRLLTALRTDSPRGGKHSRRGSRLRIKDDSDTSGSESDSGRRKSRFVGDGEHNIGPLALLLEQQAKQVQSKSPAVILPDTPDKWGRVDVDIPDAKISRHSLEVPRPGTESTNAEDHANFKIPPKARRMPTFSIDETEPRSSLEDWDSTAPNTPLQPKRFQRIGAEMSPPPSRAGSEYKKSKRSKLNIFHSSEHGEDHKPEYRPESAGTDQNGRSRQTSEETHEDKYIGTSILAAPGAVRNLLGHRKNDSVSSLPSPDKLRRRDTQEPHSAVTRFFKGVKHEGTKVGGFIFRRDRADDSDADTASDRNSVDLDTDASTRSRRTKRPPMSRSITAGTVDSVASDRQVRNHLDLPSFRPVHQTQFGDGDTSDPEHHISRQTRERKNSRSPRVDRLLPPRMDLGTISGNSSIRSLSPRRSQSQERISKVLAHPGATNMIGLPPTAMRKPLTSNDRKRSSSRPTIDGKRHWSIADDNEHALHRKSNPNVVTQADIARVRALFLCSGVKAKEITRRADTRKSTPPDFLSRAAATTKTQLFPVPRREEHVLAARILIKELESSSKSLQGSLEHFRDKAIQDLSSRIAKLQSTVDSDIMTRILDGGDQALKITSEISGQGPLQVKQITDEIDRMLRARRRRMRWVRGLGWMVVEWALVASMWCLWLVVVLVSTVKRVFGVGWGVVRWLLWL